VTQPQSLLAAINEARTRYLAEVANFSETQAHWKPAPDEWSAVEITEHLFWAEQGGLLSLWRTLASAEPVWVGESVNAGQSIEEIVARTWREKELVPAIAAPRLGGPLSYWTAMLRNLAPTLRALGESMGEADLARMTPPHPISGPLDVRQRLEFLRFHLDRHTGQVGRLRERLP